jgi:hypothetical protein
MKKVSVVSCGAALLLLCGCIYEVPLVKTAEVAVDPALTGLWQMIPDEGAPEDPNDRLMVLPFSQTEYAVVASPGADALYFRAYPVCLEGMDLVQLECLQIEPGKERYHVCRYAVEDGILSVQTLNPAVVSAKTADSAALRTALLANRSDPDLFEKPYRYRRLKD